MTTAKFTIDGSASTPPGYDATTSQVLTLQLEDLPALDARSVLFEVTQTSYGAPSLTFSPSDGMPTTPGGTVDVTMPGSVAHSYVIKCTVNDGEDANGTPVAAYTYSRLVAIRSTAGLRDMTPAERTEYDETYGWARAQNEIVTATDSIASGGSLSYGSAPPAIAAASDAGAATTPSRSDHTHAHGSQTDGTMHAAVVAAGASGFMTGADKTKLDAATSAATASVIVMRDASRTTGLSGITVPAGDSWSQTHTQHASAAGNNDSWSGQAAASGAFDGGKIRIKGGARGDGDHWQGDVELSLGPEDANDGRSAFLSLFITTDFSGTPLLKINSVSSLATIDGPSGLAIQTSSANGIQATSDGGGPIVLSSTVGTVTVSGTNLAIHGAGSFGDGVKVIFVANRTTAPTTNPTGGGILYADSGAGKWRGSGGTTTTFGPAEPHCPTCARDFAHEWANDVTGDHLAICVPCMLKEFARAGLNVSSFAFTNNLRQ